MAAYENLSFPVGSILELKPTNSWDSCCSYERLFESPWIQALMLRGRGTELPWEIWRWLEML